jgi:hypothetical protein
VSPSPPSASGVEAQTTKRTSKLLWRKESAKEEAMSVRVSGSARSARSEVGSAAVAVAEEEAVEAEEMEVPSE